jgi:hypothetical protein
MRLLLDTLRFGRAFDREDHLGMAAIRARQSIETLERMARRIYPKTRHYPWWARAMSNGHWEFLDLVTPSPRIFPESPEANPMVSGWARTFHIWRHEEGARTALFGVLDRWAEEVGADALLNILVQTSENWGTYGADILFTEASRLQTLGSLLALQSPDALDRLHGKVMESTLPEATKTVQRPRL